MSSRTCDSSSGRPSDNPLIVHISSLAQLDTLLPPSALPLSPLYQALISDHWPGPLTLLFPSSPTIPTQTTANLPTVAIRFPSHPVARALIHHAGVPLAAPSANSSGRPSPTEAQHVMNDLSNGRGVRYVLDGGSCDVGLESTVVDGLSCDPGDLKVLRPGGVTVEDLTRTMRAVEATTGAKRAGRVLVYARDFKDEKLLSAPTTPGMKYKHYTPSMPVFVLSPYSPSSSSSSSSSGSATASTTTEGSFAPSPSTAVLAHLPPSTGPQLKIGLMLYTFSQISTLLTDASLAPHETVRLELGELATPADAAHRLFSGLLELERQGCSAIFVEEGEEEGVGRAVRERLAKAAGGEQGRLVVSI